MRVIFQNHLGVATARARGVEEADGELICILDSDDMLAPHALTRLASEFERSPQTAMVYTCNWVIQPNGITSVQKYPYFKTPRAMIWATLLKPRVPFKHSGTMFRKEIAIELGSYDRSLECKIDIDFFLKFLVAGHHLKLVTEPLVFFRMHTDSISISRIQGIRAWFRLIDRYGPDNYVLRQGVKAIKAVSELSKLLYMKVAARSFTQGGNRI